MSEHLSKHYRVKHDALGWPHQITTVAERLSLDWIETYLLVSSEVLSKEIKKEPRDAP